MDVKRFPVLDHLVAMTDDTGMVQHATHDIPNRSTGYCTDDIARALIVAVNASRRPATEAVGTRLVTVYLSYLHDAQLSDGWFHNFMGYDRKWQDRRGTPDSFGRALWGLGYCMRFAPRSTWRRIAGALVANALSHVEQLEHLRSRAYAALGLMHALDAPHDVDPHAVHGRLAGLVRSIDEEFQHHARPGWEWCEEALTYDNARLPEALIRGGKALGEQRFERAGLEMLAFYTSVVFENGMFVPVGNNGWYRRGGTKARFGQQPIEAAGMIDASLAAYACSGEARHLQHAEIAFDWFLGNNTARSTLVANGGCRDGIDPTGVNPNMGAESTLAYLHASMALAKRAAERLQIAQ